MPQISINELSIGYRGPPLLDRVTCQIDSGQRIGLLGRNGSGKTTFLRILCGEVEPDRGELIFAPGTNVSLLPQEVPKQLTGTVFDLVAENAARAHDDQHDAAWQGPQQVERILSRMGLNGQARFETLSSGWKRRALLARSLVSSPDVLLLDEPTNHLDIETITWIEEFLLRWNQTLVFVTHDRTFLRKLANRILEIDRGRLFDWSCDYDTFVQRKEAALAAEEKQDALFDKRLAEEETWIRQGIKARRTRNEGRVRALEQMRQERRERRSNSGAVRMRILEGQRSGNLVVDAKDVSFAYDDVEIVHRFSTTIMRGDKVGVIGPNGIGKTTLLRILLGVLPPDQGSIRLGTNLQILYFDQLREQLDDNASVQHNVGEGYDTVGVGGRRKHIIGYLQDFLFSPERSRTEVRFLSGGERNRVLLARLFAKPANVIVLDEPTNDLDSETLELLEARLVEFDGTVLLVSHDRTFLNNVVTSTIVFEEGDLGEYVGGYDDWLRVRQAREAESDRAKRKAASAARVARVKQNAAEACTEPKRRLSYREQQELAGLPDAIEQIEQQIAQLHDAMAKPEFYQQPGPDIAREQARLNQLETDLATAYERWEQLEELA